MHHSTRNILIQHMAVALIAVLSVISGCARSADQPASSIHYVQIRDNVSPMDLYVSVGDQVRWQNLRGEPVKIGLLHDVNVAHIGCEKGFRRFGMMDEFATIQPRDFVSLCFARPGVVHYNVWISPPGAPNSITKTAVVHIERS